MVLTDSFFKQNLSQAPYLIQVCVVGKNGMHVDTETWEVS